MLIRSVVIITVFTVATLLNGCQLESQESIQSSTNTTDAYKIEGTTNPVTANDQRLLKLKSNSIYTEDEQKFYLLRSKIVQELSTASYVKMAVTEYYYSTGQFLGVAKTMDDLPANISLDNVTGRITVNLKNIDDSLTDSDTIQLVPIVNSNGITWRCESHTRADLVPPACH